MNIFRILLLLLIPYLRLAAQDNPDTLFQQGQTAFNAGEFARAAELYRTIVEKHPGYRLYNHAYYNTAYSYDEAGNIDSALAWYDRIIASDMKDDELAGRDGIFETHTNYKHFASSNAGSIEFNRKNYRKALQYYQDCLTKYPYYNRSGTDIRISRNTLVIYIADCYDMLGEYEDALATLIPEALDSYGSSNYTSVVARTMKLIDRRFDRKLIAGELEQSLSTIAPKEDGSGYDFTFHWQKLDLHPYVPSRANNAGEFIAGIRKSIFWQRLIS
jgi:tetratricopeptide (TPR) repeat protein